MTRVPRVQRVQRALLCVCLCLSACEKSRPPKPQAAPPIPAHAAATAGAWSGADARPRADVVFSEREGGIAEIRAREGGFEVAHNGRAGKRYAAVGEVVLSRDGRRCAYPAAADGAWRMVVDGKEGEPFQLVGMPVFSPDGAHVVYPAQQAERWRLVVDGVAAEPIAGRYLTYAFSADGARLVVIEGDEGAGTGRLVISDRTLRKATFVEPAVTSMLLDPTATRLAAVAVSGAEQRVVTLELARPEAARRGAAYAAVSAVSFAADGGAVGYVADRPDGKLLVLGDREVPILGGHVVGAPVLLPGDRAAVLVASMSGSVLLRELPGEGKSGERSYEEADGLVYSADGRHHAYAARRGAGWFLVLDGKEGPPFDRVVSPVFSADGRSVAYRARKDGMRFVVVADVATGTVSLHPPHEQVFPVLFTAGGKSVAYGVKDGARLAWQVEER